MADDAMTIAGLLLAAGHGRRFDPDGRQSKLEALIDGEAVALHALRSLAAGCDQVLVVCRPDQTALATVLSRAGAIIHFLDGSKLAQGGEGMGASLAAGAAALLDRSARGAIDLADPSAVVLVMPADMPWVRPETVRQIALTSTAASIVVPTLDAGAPDAQGGRHDPNQGHPVRFAAALLPELAALGGDRGARPLLARHPVCYLPIGDTGIVRDVDTPADLSAGAAPGAQVTDPPVAGPARAPAPRPPRP